MAWLPIAPDVDDHAGGHHEQRRPRRVGLRRDQDLARLERGDLRRCRATTRARPRATPAEAGRAGQDVAGLDRRARWPRPCAARSDERRHRLAADDEGRRLDVEQLLPLPLALAQRLGEVGRRAWPARRAPGSSAMNTCSRVVEVPVGGQPPAQLEQRDPHLVQDLHRTGLARARARRRSAGPRRSPGAASARPPRCRRGSSAPPAAPAAASAERSSRRRAGEALVVQLAQPVDQRQRQLRLGLPECARRCPTRSGRGSRTRARRCRSGWRSPGDRLADPLEQARPRPGRTRRSARRRRARRATGPTARTTAAPSRRRRRCRSAGSRSVGSVAPISEAMTPGPIAAWLLAIT